VIFLEPSISRNGESDIAMKAAATSQPTQNKSIINSPSVSEITTPLLTNNDSASSQQLAILEAIHKNTLQDMARSIYQLQNYMNEFSTQ